MIFEVEEYAIFACPAHHFSESSHFNPANTELEWIYSGGAGNAGGIGLQFERMAISQETLVPDSFAFLFGSGDLPPTTCAWGALSGLCSLDFTGS